MSIYVELSGAEHCEQLSQRIADTALGIGGVALSAEQIEESEDGVFLNPNLELEGNPVSLKDVKLLPDTMMLGVGQSHHQVMFGTVELSLDGEDDPKPVDVALKSYDTASGGAFKEMGTLLAIAQRGIKTFTPLGIFKLGDESILATVKYPNLFALDKLKWHLRPSDTNYEEICTPIAQMAEGLATLHANGVFHGDPVPKNFAVDDSNELVFFDFEDTTVLPEGEDPIEAIEGYGFIEESLALNDVVHFWMFQTAPYEVETPFLIEEEPDVLLSEFITRFLNPYTDELSLKVRSATPKRLEVLRQAAIEKVAKLVGAELQ